MQEKLLDDLPESFDGWLWKDQKLIPRNELTAVVGFDGVGKTTFCLSLGARLTRGELSGKAEKVFFAMQEDALSITKARLHANGADPWMCSFQPDDTEGKFAQAWTFPENLDEFEDYIAWTGCTVAIIDSVDFHIDSITGQKARQTLGRLREICERRNLTIILVHHFNKVGTEIDKAIGGGRGVKATMRCILIWGEKAGSYMGMQMPQSTSDDDDPEAEQKRDEVQAAVEDFEDATHVLAVHKNSYGLKYPHKLSMLYQAIERPHPYDPNESVILFDHVTDWPISPQQVFRPQGYAGASIDPHASTKRGEAKNVMLQILALAGESWVPAEELNSILAGAGFSNATVRDARRELQDEGLIEKQQSGAASGRRGSAWSWRIKPLDLPTTE